MRLFGQLSSDEQNNAIHYCVHLIVEDMLESDEFELDTEGKCDEHKEEDEKIQEHLNAVLTKAKELPEEEQFDYILSDEESGQVIFDIAMGMSRNAYYHEQEELVIFPGSLADEEDEEELDEDEIKEEKKNLN